MLSLSIIIFLKKNTCDVFESSNKEDRTSSIFNLFF